jgi:shikimate 5-dehydrogenase
MLVEQAKPSYEIWSGNKIGIDRKIYQMLINKI